MIRPLYYCHRVIAGYRQDEMELMDRAIRDHVINSLNARGLYVENANGKVLKVLNPSVDMKLKPDTVDARMAIGLDMKNGFDVQPGKYTRFARRQDVRPQ
jgi:hypothetical protein